MKFFKLKERLQRRFFSWKTFQKLKNPTIETLNNFTDKIKLRKFVFVLKLIIIFNVTQRLFNNKQTRYNNLLF